MKQPLSKELEAFLEYITVNKALSKKSIKKEEKSFSKTKKGQRYRRWLDYRMINTTYCK